jgi:hypothetical protein
LQAGDVDIEGDACGGSAPARKIVHADQLGEVLVKGGAVDGRGGEGEGEISLGFAGGPQ